MNIIKIDKFFVVSLPRTGTKSLCKMAEILGVSYKHVPSTSFPRMLLENKIQLFADTPIFAPSVFKSLISAETHKFIYIDRPVDEWVKSFESVRLSDSYMALRTEKITPNCVNRMDRKTLEEIFFNEDYTTELAIRAHAMHKRQVMDSIPSNRLLVYKFSDGWEPITSFMHCTAPDIEIPHINKNTIYETI